MYHKIKKKRSVEEAGLDPIDTDLPTKKIKETINPNDLVPLILDAKWNDLGELKISFNHTQKISNFIQYCELYYCYINENNINNSVNETIDTLAYKSQWKISTIPMTNYLCNLYVNNNNNNFIKHNKLVSIKSCRNNNIKLVIKLRYILSLYIGECFSEFSDIKILNNYQITPSSSNNNIIDINDFNVDFPINYSNAGWLNDKSRKKYLISGFIRNIIFKLNKKNQNIGIKYLVIVDICKLCLKYNQKTYPKPDPKPICINLGGSMLIHLKELNGFKYSAYVDENVTVKQIKIGASEIECVPACQLRLIFKGKLLYDSDTLKDKGVKAGMTLHTAIMLRGS